jgi:type IV secretory pathway VirB2 component (pilin)
LPSDCFGLAVRLAALARILRQPQCLQRTEGNPGQFNPRGIIQSEEWQMNKDILGTVANIVATIGIVICAVSGLARLLGHFHVLGYAAITLFTGGMSLMVLAALIKLHIIESRMSSKQ